ncbi:MAG: TlyA family RNA methyltransferase, partial [Deltaproteobacteria bacterium]|nr:TlyA family RNA methyltransferase [Deltaproteobacteria bacterium]
MSGGKSRSEKIRLDLLLVERGLAESREKAKRMIMAGLVEVDGLRVDKPGHTTQLSSSLVLKEPHPPYVSRGGLKLEAALKAFSVDVQGKVLLDVGASTGGFTDCLLQHGAKRVIALDVGYGQLHWKLRQDPRVRVLERSNARYLRPEDLGERVEGAVIDVSFISLKLVVPPVSACLGENSFIIALIKPQFEVGKGKVGKGGVVRDPELHRQVLADLSSFFTEAGWSVGEPIPSPILGPKG